MTRELLGPLRAAAAVRARVRAVTRISSLGIVPAGLAFRIDDSGTAQPIGNDVEVTMVHAEHDSNPGDKVAF